MVTLFLLAVVSGLAVSIPPGPLGALCVIRTARAGLASGLATALAIGAVDGLLFGAIAALGADSVAKLPPWIRQTAAGIVAVALFFVGLAVFRRAGTPPAGDAEEKPIGAWKGAGAAALLALGTPGTLPALFVLFASFGINDPYIGAAGVFLGGLAWWATLCLVTHFVREHARKALHVMDYACGALLWLGSGAAAKFAILP